MEERNQPLEEIKAIKKIMEQSTRFLSLSGLSGISAGIVAIVGAIAARLIIQGPVVNAWGYSNSISDAGDSRRILLLLLLNAAIVLVLALSSVLFFSIRKAKRSGDKIWTPVSKRLLLNLAIPLLAGGLFILLTLGKLHGSIIAATTLIFYGLALVNAAKFTLGEIFWLGIMELVTGFLCLAIPGYAFVFWVFGFGLLHIGYGLFMYLKYKG